MSLPITAFIVQRLLEFDPTFDVGSGVATSGLMIEPLSVVLQPVVDELTVVQATQSILTILESAAPDLFPEDVVDAIASNFIVSRRPGQIGSTTQRMRFFEPQAFSAPQRVLIWRGQSSLRYTNSEPVQISRAEMALNQDGSLYYVDIPVVATDQGSDYNADPNTITTMESAPVGLASTGNLFRVSDGVSRETNTQLISRIKVAVTVRALVTGRGIIVTLTENFTTIVEVQPIGFGAPEMMRDIVYNVHIGGDVDVFVRGSALAATQQDIINLKVDASRLASQVTSMTLLEQDIGYFIGWAAIDRTLRAPTVKSIDGFVLYAEGHDYALDDLNGILSRAAGSTIFHLSESSNGGAVISAKRLRHTIMSSFFQNVRAGMILTVTGPSGVAGRYTIKSQIASDTVEIYGTFPVASQSNVNFQVDDLLRIEFDYNPVSIDVVATPRSTGRAGYTISNVPLMRIAAMEVLDPITLQPTGAVFNVKGGYGAGGYGQGIYGQGSQSDYRLVVTDPTARFSAKESNYVEFLQSNVGMSVRVSYLYDTDIPALQAFVEDPQNRTEAASLLVRHFVPIYVESQQAIVYTIKASTLATAPTVDVVAALVADLVNNVVEGASLELSDIVDLLYNNGADEVDLDGLQALRGELHHQDGTVEYLLPTPKGLLTIPNAPITDPSQRPLSQRIARFISGTINLTRNVA